MFDLTTPVTTRPTPLPITNNNSISAPPALSAFHKKELEIVAFESRLPGAPEIKKVQYARTIATYVCEKVAIREELQAQKNQISYSLADCVRDLERLEQALLLLQQHNYPVPPNYQQALCDLALERDDLKRQSQLGSASNVQSHHLPSSSSYNSPLQTSTAPYVPVCTPSFSTAPSYPNMHSNVNPSLVAVQNQHVYPYGYNAPNSTNVNNNTNYNRNIGTNNGNKNDMNNNIVNSNSSRYYESKSSVGVTDPRQNVHYSYMSTSPVIEILDDPERDRRMQLVRSLREAAQPQATNCSLWTWQTQKNGIFSLLKVCCCEMVIFDCWYALSCRREAQFQLWLWTCVGLNLPTPSSIG